MLSDAVTRSTHKRKKRIRILERFIESLRIESLWILPISKVEHWASGQQGNLITLIEVNAVNCEVFDDVSGKRDIDHTVQSTYFIDEVVELF